LTTCINSDTNFGMIDNLQHKILAINKNTNWESRLRRLGWQLSNQKAEYENQ